MRSDLWPAPCHPRNPAMVSDEMRRLESAGLLWDMVNTQPADLVFPLPADLVDGWTEWVEAAYKVCGEYGVHLCDLWLDVVHERWKWLP